jgi:non-reducing end alpha-L-arabinofuranosidase
MKTRIRLAIILALAFTLPFAGLIMAKQAGLGSNAPARPQGPGDIYAAAGCPLVAAHSTTRALFATYSGPLYQVRRLSDGKALDSRSASRIIDGADTGRNCTDFRLQAPTPGAPNQRLQ